MTQLNQFFLQSITLNDLDLPRQAVFKSMYIEKTTLTAPVLVLLIHDPGGKVADDYKAVYGSTLVAEIGDPTGDTATYKETFFVTSAPVAGDVVTLTATTKDIVRVKTPSVKAWLYANRQPSDVMNAYKGDMTLVSDVVKKACTYHLNVGEKPSKVLSQMAKDRAALVWMAQGVFHFRDFDSLLTDEVAFEYEAYNPSAKYTVSRMKYLNQDNDALAATRFHFTAWSPTDGYIQAGDSTNPVKHVSDTDLATLRAMARTIIPKVQIDVAGNPAIKAGQIIGLTIHRMDKENQLSEAMPKKLIVLRVAHVEQRDSYMTRMILGVPN